MTHTPNLSLPYLAAAQAQKHVTVNEVFSLIDALTQMAVTSVGATSPPTTPTEGERHIIGTGATGAWSGWDNSIALYSGGAWLRLIPQVGWQAWDVTASELLLWTGSAWEALDVALKLLTRTASVRVGQGLAGAATDIDINEEQLSGLSGASVTSTITIPDRARRLDPHHHRYFRCHLLWLRTFGRGIKVRWQPRYCRWQHQCRRHRPAGFL